jgi:hypothetical protein
MKTVTMIRAFRSRCQGHTRISSDAGERRAGEPPVCVFSQHHWRSPWATVLEEPGKPVTARTNPKSVKGATRS